MEISNREPIIPDCPMHFHSVPYHPFSFGRPLWGSMFSRFGEEPDFAVGLVKYACRLLMPDNVESDCNTSLGLFGCRFSLTAYRQRAAQLVRSHLAVVLDVLPGTHELICGYYPEPVLAEASLMLMWVEKQFEKVLADLLRLLMASSMISINIGDLGEIMSFVYLSAVLDSIKINNVTPRYNGRSSSFLSGVSLEAFLRKLTGEAGQALKCVSQYQVNCTHAYRPQTGEMVLTRESILNLYYRGCALYATACFPGIDIVVPLLCQTTLCQPTLETAEVGLLLVQVKNYKSKISKATADIIFNEIKLSSVCKDNRVSCVRMLICVGSGGCDTVCRQPPDPRPCRGANRQPASPILEICCGILEHEAELRLGPIVQGILKLLAQVRCGLRKLYCPDPLLPAFPVSNHEVNLDHFQKTDDGKFAEYLAKLAGPVPIRVQKN